MEALAVVPADSVRLPPYGSRSLRRVRRWLSKIRDNDDALVTAVADAERMRNEGAILKQNPLLINKIVAEKLSDKLQIMMVPSDGKFFFANDVLKSMNMANRGSEADQAEEK